MDEEEHVPWISEPWLLLALAVLLVIDGAALYGLWAIVFSMVCR